MEVTTLGGVWGRGGREEGRGKRHLHEEGKVGGYRSRGGGLGKGGREGRGTVKVTSGSKGGFSGEDRRWGFV